MNSGNGRKTVGFQTFKMGSGYPAKIWPGAVACAESRDANLIIFPGNNLEVPHGFVFQYNIIYKLMNRNVIDALVLNTSMICNYVDFDAVRDFCLNFGDIPVVSIGGIIPGIPSILTDNTSGIKDLTRHLAVTHGAGRIAFIKGPESHWESNERFRAFSEEMAAHNLHVDSDLVEQGDFTAASVIPALDRLLKKCGKLPDALMFANDEMALCGIGYLQEKGFVLPRDIAVTGFDDIDDSMFTNPPLTTIHQNYYDMSWEGVRVALDLLDGKSVRDITYFPTKSILRSSCGCLMGALGHIQSVVKTGRSIKDDIDRVSSACDLVFQITMTEIEISPGIMVSRKEAIQNIIQKMLVLSQSDKTDSDKDSAHALFLRYFTEILETELNGKKEIRDWLVILSAIAESLYKFKPALKDDKDIQIAIRLGSVLVGEISEHHTKNSTYIENNFQNILRDVLSEISSIVQMDTLMNSLRQNMPLLKIDTFVLSTYEIPWAHERNSRWDIPDNIRCAGGLSDGVPLGGTIDGNTEYAFSKLLPKGVLEQKKRHTLLVYPLFFRETQYGLFVFNFPKVNGILYESLAASLSGVIKSIFEYREKELIEDKLRITMQELQDYNERLNNLSITDELTGLYNRRGFAKLVEQQHRLTVQMDKNALLLYFDLDGLKKINDLYGHDEGDWAIREMSEILRKTFRNMDIIARLGGDEFTVYTPNTGIEILEIFKRRLNALLEETNHESGKPFSISVSFGVVECKPEDTRSLDEYMKAADELLYREKRIKKDLPI